MDKTTFIESLKQGLKKHDIKDIAEILEDYEAYFYHQLKLGKTEEDIANRLGDINKIIEDYKFSSDGINKRWFDLVSISFIAIPMLILLYGLLIVFIGTSIASWAIAIYYLFQIKTFSFMPNIPLGVHLLYVVTFLAWAVFFFSLSIRFAIQIKSMTLQYIVKQSIRIGEYLVKSVYIKLFNYSLIIGSALIFISYITSAIIAKDFEFWHAWNWFS